MMYLYKVHASQLEIMQQSD